MQPGPARHPPAVAPAPDLSVPGTCCGHNGLSAQQSRVDRTISPVVSARCAGPSELATGGGPDAEHLVTRRCDRGDTTRRMTTRWSSEYRWAIIRSGHPAATSSRNEAGGMAGVPRTKMPASANHTSASAALTPCRRAITVTFPNNRQSECSRDTEGFGLRPGRRRQPEPVDRPVHRRFRRPELARDVGHRASLRDIPRPDPRPAMELREPHLAMCPALHDPQLHNGVPYGGDRAADVVGDGPSMASRWPSSR